MKANPDKCHLRVNESCEKEIEIADNITENNKCEKLLGTKIDSKLCSSRKMRTLARITPSMDLQKNLSFLTFFFKYVSSCFPLA